jgi:hypothetical protein
MFSAMIKYHFVPEWKESARDTRNLMALYHRYFTAFVHQSDESFGLSRLPFISR